MLKKLFGFFLAAVILAGCESDDSEGMVGEVFKEEVFTLHRHFFEVPASGGTFSVEVASNIEYAVTIPEAFQPWIAALPKSRAVTSAGYRFSVAENTDLETREGYVLFAGQSLADTVYVWQAAGAETPAGEFPQTEYTVNYQGASQTIEFTVPVAWQASISYDEGAAEWLSVSAMDGEAGVTTLVATATENLVEIMRKAYIDIAYGSKTQRLTVTQDAKLGENTDITNKFNPEFAQVLQEKGYIQDANHITWGEVNKTTDIRVKESQLTSLQGIEYFTALGLLSCGNNQLTGLDVSKCTELHELYCGGNQLTALDVSKNTNLARLDCYENQLTKLDISKNIKLDYLDCAYNQLTDLDVSMNTELVKLRCQANQLTKLDIGTNVELAYLICRNNPFTKLDVSKNAKLEYLDCANNQLTELDLSRNTELISLICTSNKFTELDVSKNLALETLHCYLCSELTTLDVSMLTKLTSLSCRNTKLAKLDVSKNTELTDLDCLGCQLTSLDVSKNKKLTELKCHNNPGNGTVFPLTAWFGESNMPDLLEEEWTYGGKHITLQIQQ